MSTQLQNDNYLPTNEDALNASRALSMLSPFFEKQSHVAQIPLEELAKFKKISMPQGVFKLLLELLHQTSQGRAVYIFSSNKEFTTQESADLLNVSRPFVIKLLKEGKLPFHMVGTHRRIKAQDLMAYRKMSEEQQLSAFQELAKISQDVNWDQED